MVLQPGEAAKNGTAKPSSFGTSLPVWNKRYRFQILATFSVHILTVTHGVGVGWLAPVLTLLQTESSPLGVTITVSEASWIGSLVGVGSITGNILFGLLLDRIGRKWCMKLVAVPIMLCWVLIYFSQNVHYLYIGRFFAGITGGGLYVIFPIFISEIVDTSIRGGLSSIAMMSSGVGVLLGAIMSTYITYYVMPCVVITFPFLYLLATMALPETPPYLLKCGKIVESEHSYRFYKNMPSKYDDVLEQQRHQEEFETFKMEVLKGCHGTTKVMIADFWNRDAMKMFSICLMVLFTNQISGSFAFFNYTTDLFVELGTNLDPNACTILVGVIQLVGNFILISLVDRFGRRVFFLASTFSMGLTMVSVGLFKQFATLDTLNEYNWLALVLMCSISFSAAMGLIPLLQVIIVEVLPAKIRSIGSSVCMLVLSCLVFVDLKIYPLLLFGYGLPTLMYFSATACFFGVILLGIYLPETKNKSMTQ